MKLNWLKFGRNRKILTWVLYRFSASWRSVSFLVCPFLLFSQESQSVRTSTFKQKRQHSLICDDNLTICADTVIICEVMMCEDSHLSRNISSSWKQTSRTSSDSLELISCASLGIALIHWKRDKTGNNVIIWQANIEFKHKQVNQNPFSGSSLIITIMVLI